MSNMSCKEKNRIIKKALVKEYKDKAKVTVRGGTGTSYGWVYIDLNFFKNKDKDTKEKMKKISTKAKKIAKKALKDVGESFFTYTADDGIGYGKEIDCVLVMISKI